MKRKETLGVVLLVVCFLTACGQAGDPGNLFEMPATQEELLTEMDTEEKTESNAGEEYEFESLEEYQYGNMQKNAPPGDFMLYENNIVFIYYDQERQTSLLYMMDKDTGEISPFCRDATCMHNTAYCASGGVMANLEQYDGKLYAMSGGWQIMELKNGRFERIADGAVYNFWHAGNNLYAVSKDGSLIAFEEGKSTPRILIDEYTDYWNTVFGHYLYGYTSQGVSRVDLQAEKPQKEILFPCESSIIDGEHIYYFESKTFCLYRSDMDGSNPVQLTDQPILPASINFDEDYLYFRLFTNLEMDGEGCRDIYRLRKGELQDMEKIAELPDTAYTIYTVPGYDKLIVMTAQTHEADANGGMYTVAKDGSSVEKLEIPEF